MKKKQYAVRDLLQAVPETFIGDLSYYIVKPSTIMSPENCSIMFVSAAKWKDEFLDKLQCTRGSVIIIEPELKGKFLSIAENNLIIVTNNARLYFAKALQAFVDALSTNRRYTDKGSGVVIGEDVQIGKKCTIEPFVFIDHDVVIGDYVTIKTGTKIRKSAVIGSHVVIGENCVIGAQGFGIERDIDGRNIRIPHIGGVVIGDNVEIGALTSIVSGTITPTIIGDNCFIDDLVHIAHNCNVGNGTQITACAQMGGSSKVGQDCFISPNCTIRNGVSIGDECFVGQASSVQKSFGDGLSIVGNPARVFEPRK